MSTGPTVALIFGGTGQIGGALVRALQPLVAQEQIELRLAVRSTRRAATILEGVRASFIEFDLDVQGPDVEDALNGVDVMFLLTGYSVEMLAQSKRAIDLAVRAGVRHIVHSGAHAAWDTTNAHLGWHLFVERYIERSGLAWTHLRPNWLMQNVMRLVRDEGEGLVLSCCLPEARRVSWIDAADAGAVAAAVLESPSAHLGATYGLAAEALSLREVANLIAAAVGAPCRYEQVSLEAFRAARYKSQTHEAYQVSAFHYYEELTAGRIPECEEVFDVQSLLGRPPTSWSQFAHGHAARFGQHEG